VWNAQGLKITAIMDQKPEHNLPTEAGIRASASQPADFKAKADESGLRTQAEAFVTALVTGGGSTNEKQGSIFHLAAAEQAKVLEMGKGFNIRLKDLKQGEEGTKIAGLIEKLSEDFERINPGRIDWKSAPRKGIGKLLSKLPLIGTAVSQYWAKYQDVMTMINENIATLNSLLDKKEKDVLLINDKKDAFLKMMEQYHQSIRTAVLIKEALEEKIVEEADPEKKRFMQEQWLYPLDKRLISLQELYLSSYDAAISAELISRGHRELIADLREKNKVATLRLQTGVWLAAELYDQQRLLESSRALKETNKNLADAVHQMLGKYQKEIQAEVTDSFQSFDQWQQHMQETSKLYQEAKDFRVNSLSILDDKISKFGELMQTAEQTGAELREAGAAAQPFGQ
jgi:uncharacterized protein YaaN involved in tellurite resistance